MKLQALAQTVFELAVILVAVSFVGYTLIQWFAVGATVLVGVR